MRSATKWLLGILGGVLVLAIVFFTLTHQSVRVVPEPPDRVPTDIDLTKPNPLPETSSNQTSSTYVNSKMGFSFKMPADYFVLESYNYEGGFSVGLSFAKKTANSQVLQSSGVGMVVYQQDKMTLDSLKKRMESLGSVVVGSNNIKVDGQDAIRYDLGGMIGGQEIDAVSGKYAVVLNDENSQSTGLDINQIASTFKFSK